MTRYLFADNFRGFANTYIPIVDVNFFVGENSSGKTSILGLLQLLSKSEFLWAQKFSNEHVNFGHFGDMVSAHSSDRSYFSFGSIDVHPHTHKLIAELYTFKEHEGLARISQFTTIVGARQVSLRVDGKKTQFKTVALPVGLTAEDLKTRIFPLWADERFSDDSDYREVQNVPGYPNPDQYPLYVPLMMAVEQSRQKGERDDPSQLFYPRRELVWIAPIRTQPERTYDDISKSDFSAEGAHTPYLIRKAQNSSEKEKFKTFIDHAGASSGLFEELKINTFGKEVTAPFEVDAVLDGIALNLINVGYGVSQSLPVFVEIITRPAGTWFAIQQPEVHLHPRAQAALGDAFFEMAVSDKKRFLIETHSDFAIDRFRMNFRKRGKKPNSQVLFFERKNKKNTATSLAIASNGEMPSDQPDGYRQFFVKEEMRLLGL